MKRPPSKRNSLTLSVIVVAPALVSVMAVLAVEVTVVDLLKLFYRAAILWIKLIRSRYTLYYIFLIFRNATKIIASIKGTVRRVISKRFISGL